MVFELDLEEQINFRHADVRAIQEVCINLLSTVTKYHVLGGLNNRNAFSHSPED